LPGYVSTVPRVASLETQSGWCVHRPALHPLLRHMRDQRRPMRLPSRLHGWGTGPHPRVTGAPCAVRCAAVLHAERLRRSCAVPAACTGYLREGDGMSAQWVGVICISHVRRQHHSPVRYEGRGNSGASNQPASKPACQTVKPPARLSRGASISWLPPARL
jgi:hypothetical protein